MAGLMEMYQVTKDKAQAKSPLVEAISGFIDGINILQQRKRENNILQRQQTGDDINNIVKLIDAQKNANEAAYKQSMYQATPFGAGANNSLLLSMAQNSGNDLIKGYVNQITQQQQDPVRASKLQELINSTGNLIPAELKMGLTGPEYSFKDKNIMEAERAYKNALLGIRSSELEVKKKNADLRGDYFTNTVSKGNIDKLKIQLNYLGKIIENQTGIETPDRIQEAIVQREQLLNQIEQLPEVEKLIIEQGIFGDTVQYVPKKTNQLENMPKKTTQYRQQAIKYLQDRGYKINEQNIQKVLNTLQ